MRDESKNEEEETRRIPHISHFSLHPSTFILSRGFTLLELIVVIFVVSVVLALVLPSFTGIGESRISSEAKRLASIVRYLNDNAISTKETIQMKINLSDRAVSYTGPDGEKAERFGDISAIDLQSKGTVSEGEVTVFFGPLGAQESFSIYLGAGDSRMTVSFNSVSGKVKINKVEG